MFVEPKETDARVHTHTQIDRDIDIVVEMTLLIPVGELICHRSNNVQIQDQ